MNLQQCRCRSVTQRCIGTGCDHGCHPLPTRTDNTMANRVDASMDGVQPPAREPVLDCAAPHTDLDQLGAPDDTVLALRQLRNPPINQVST
jgi:hypothetical protein